MSRMRVPRQHRRFSLPATSTLMPLGFTRGIPEGSDMFQKALEDLCTNEPDYGVSQSEDPGVGYNGLGNIQEGNESDYSEENDDTDGPSFDVRSVDDVTKKVRRHSSPNCYSPHAESDETLITDNNNKKKDIDSIMKSHNRLRMEYFKRHGHWPVSTTIQTITNQRPKTSGAKVRSDIAFGTKIPK